MKESFRSLRLDIPLDIKQTEGEPLPELCHNLEGSLSDRQKQIKDILLDIARFRSASKQYPGMQMDIMTSSKKKSS